MSAYLPAIIFGIFAGVLVDQHNRMKLMLISNFSQAIIVAIIPMLLFIDIKIGLIIGVLALLRASFGSLFPPALNAFLPEIFPKDKLIKINSLIATSGQFAYFTGPVIAGILLNIMSIEILFAWDALSFLLAAIVLMTIHYPDKLKESTIGSRLQELRSGFTYLKANRSLRLLIILTIINNIFIMGPAIVGIPIMIKYHLLGSASDFAFVEAGMASKEAEKVKLFYKNQNQVTGEIAFVKGNEWVAGNLSYHLKERPKWIYDPNNIFICNKNLECVKYK